MRFLSREWVEGQLDHFSRDLYYGVYLRHVSELGPDLPEQARRLATTQPGLLLMGAQLASAALSPSGDVLRLTIESGAKLELEYTLANPGSVDMATLQAASATLTEEFDYGPQGTFIHRLLLYPEGECEVIFSDLKLRLTEADRTPELEPDGEPPAKPRHKKSPSPKSPAAKKSNAKKSPSAKPKRQPRKPRDPQ